MGKEDSHKSHAMEPVTLQPLAKCTDFFKYTDRCIEPLEFISIGNRTQYKPVQPCIFLIFPRASLCLSLSKISSFVTTMRLSNSLLRFISLTLHNITNISKPKIRH